MLEEFLGEASLPTKFFTVFTFCQQRKFADIVYVLDEGLPVDVMAWVDSSVMHLEDRLTSSGIGDNATHNNLYGLVLFGVEGNHSVVRILAPNNTELATAQIFSNNLANVLNNLQPTGDDIAHDGYAAIDRALGIGWRPTSSRVIIFISDRERDLIFRNITRSMLITKMVDTQINLNVMLNVSIVALSGTDHSFFTRNPALGVVFANQSLSYYTTSSSNNTETSLFPKILGTNETSSIVFDYASLPDVINSQVYGTPVITALWGLQSILDNTTIQAFNDVFFHNIAFEIQQTNITQISCQACKEKMCYYLANVLITSDRAQNVCMSRGGKLADIADQTQINNLRSFYNENFYINSYQNNVKPCLAVMGNSTATIDCNQLRPALCEVDRSPLFGC